MKRLLKFSFGSILPGLAAGGLATLISWPLHSSAWLAQRNHNEELSQLINLGGPFILVQLFAIGGLTWLLGAGLYRSRQGFSVKWPKVLGMAVLAGILCAAFDYLGDLIQYKVGTAWPMGTGVPLGLALVYIVQMPTASGLKRVAVIFFGCCLTALVFGVPIAFLLSTPGYFIKGVNMFDVATLGMSILNTICAGLFCLYMAEAESRDAYTIIVRRREVHSPGRKFSLLAGENVNVGVATEGKDHYWVLADQDRLYVSRGPYRGESSVACIIPVGQQVLLGNVLFGFDRYLFSTGATSI